MPRTPWSRSSREPKNALVRQYQRLFDFEDVKLEFTEEALHAVARQAIERKAGARGLRSILEHIMLDVMYEIPSQTNIKKCIVNEDVVSGKVPPEIVHGKNGGARLTTRAPGGGVRHDGRA